MDETRRRKNRTHKQAIAHTHSYASAAGENPSRYQSGNQPMLRGLRGCQRSLDLLLPKRPKSRATLAIRLPSKNQTVYDYNVYRWDKNGPSARCCASCTILAQSSRLDPAEVALGEEDVESYRCQTQGSTSVRGLLSLPCNCEIVQSEDVGLAR